MNDIYAILWVEKTFNAQPADQVLKSYLPGATSGNKSGDVEKQCLGLKGFAQPFVFAFVPLFEQKDAAPASGSSALSPAKSPAEKVANALLAAPQMVAPQRRLSSASKAQLAQPNNAPAQKMKLREGFIPFKIF